MYRGAHCTRETFASAVDQVIVMSISCDKPGLVSFTAALSREQDAKASTIAPSRIALDGEAIARDERHADERKVGTKFRVLTEVAAERWNDSQHRQRSHRRWRGLGADLCCGCDELQGKRSRSKSAPVCRLRRKDYATLREAHVRDYQSSLPPSKSRLQIGCPESSN